MGSAEAGPCVPAKNRPHAVCIREARGRWQEYDAASVLRSDDYASRGYELLRWIPTAEGGAVGVLRGVEAGWLDAKTGKVTELGREQRSKALKILSPGRHGAIHRDWTVTADGALRGWYGGHNYEISRTSGIVESAYRFHSGAGSGRYGLGQTHGRCYQTLDWGRSWTEVAGPPDPVVGGLSACSAVGCNLSGWFRLGWKADPPGVPAELTPATPAPALRAAPLPRLRCNALGAARIRRVPDNAPGLLEQTTEWGFGARVVRVSDGNTVFYAAPIERRLNHPTRPNDAHWALRALVYGQLPRDAPGRWLGANLRRSVWFTRPFDPSGRVREARFRLGDVLRATGDETQRFEMVQYGANHPLAVPVLSQKPAEAGGLALLDRGMLLWLRGQAQPTATVWQLGIEYASMIPSSAAVTGRDRLTLLLHEPDRSHLVEANRAGVQPLLSLPGVDAEYGHPTNPDAILLAPSGAEGIVRTPSGTRPPTAADPALLLRAGEPPQPLAPWSTLTSAARDECRAMQAPRVLVEARASWLALDFGGLVTREGPMFAVVRWGRERICLEAVEAPVLSPENTDLHTYLVARLAPKAWAARHGFMRGAELVQQTRCTLVPVSASLADQE